MESYYKNEPLRTYGVPIRSRDYVDEYDSMSTDDRIADVLSSLQQASIDRRTRDLAFLGDLQDFAKTKSPEQRDTALMGARTLTPMEEEVQALVDREEGKSFDIDAILAGDAPRPGEKRREMAREMQAPPEMMINDSNLDEEAKRQERIQAVKDNNAALIARLNAEKAGQPSSDELIQNALDEGRITFAGKTLDDVLAEMNDKPAYISDEDMANRIVARTGNSSDELLQNALNEGRITFGGIS
jgi:hypothetical protein